MADKIDPAHRTRRRRREGERERLSDAKDTGRTIRQSLSVGIGIVVVWAVIWLITRAAFDSDLAQMGPVGDSFGVPNSLFSGLAFAGVILTIWMQGKELRLQRRELEMTRSELKGSRSAQEELAKGQALLVEASRSAYLMSIQPMLVPAFSITSTLSLENIGNGPAFRIRPRVRCFGTAIVEAPDSSERKRDWVWEGQTGPLERSCRSGPDAAVSASRMYGSAINVDVKAKLVEECGGDVRKIEVGSSHLVLVAYCDALGNEYVTEENVIDDTATVSERSEKHEYELSRPTEIAIYPADEPEAP